MIIYNTTLKIDWSIAEDWLQWTIQKYIPAVMETGCFDKHQFVRLLEVDETEGPTYALQYFAPSLTSYDYYLQHYSASFHEMNLRQWGDKYVAFSSIMQVVTEV